MESKVLSGVSHRVLVSWLVLLILLPSSTKSFISSVFAHARVNFGRPQASSLPRDGGGGVMLKFWLQMAGGGTNRKDPLVFIFRPYLKYGREIIHSNDALFYPMLANCVHVFADVRSRLKKIETFKMFFCTRRMQF